MKKLLVAIFTLLLLSPGSFAADRTLTFAWDQPNIPSDLAGWNLWVGDAQGGPYTDGPTFFRDANGNPVGSINIPFSGNPAPSYETEAMIVIPDGETKTLHFVVTARDTDGNVSGFSNEVTKPFDFEAPGNPINLIIKVVAQQ